MKTKKQPVQLNLWGEKVSKKKGKKSHWDFERDLVNQMIRDAKKGQK